MPILRQDADALIPVEVSREIIKSMPEQSSALQLMRRLPNMTAKQRRIPVLSQLVTAGFVNGDMGLKQTTQAAWKNKYIEAEEIATIVVIPEAVLDDASYDIWGEIRPLIVEAFGAVIDGAMLFNIDRPATWPQGLFQQLSAAGHTVELGTGTDIASDISSMMALVESDGFEVTGFASDVALRANLRDLRDATNGLLYQPSLLTGTPNTLYGQPIHHVRNGTWDSSDVRVIGGDWSQAVYSIRQDITFKRLDQAVISDGDGKIVHNLAQQDMVGLRCVMRLGWQLANPINRMNQDENTRFPFAALVPAP